MTKQLLQTDLLVIGGGASGLAAAIAAKRICGDRFSVCIAEQNPRVGKKILVTGNGRCNLGNTSKDYAAYHGSLTAVLPEFLSQTLPQKNFFKLWGYTVMKKPMADYIRTAIRHLLSWIHFV